MAQFDTEAAARRAADAIRRFWADRGHEVHVHAVKVTSEQPGEPMIWTVQSDMKNGLPREADPELIERLKMEIRA